MLVGGQEKRMTEETFIHNLESYSKDTLEQILDYYNIKVPKRATKKQLIDIIVREATKDQEYQAGVQEEEKENKVSVRVQRILESLNEES